MANSKKRKSQPGAPGKGRYLSKSSKKQKKSLDLYEASDSDPDEEKHAERYDKVDNYEYELPSDFEDEEIDEDLAFTEEDKKKYAGWFGEEADAQIDRQQNQRHRGEFAELDSSSQEEADEDEDDDVESDGGDEDAHGHGSEEEHQQEGQQQQQHANGLADLASDDDLQDALAGSGSSSSGDDDYDGEPGDTDDGTDELDEDRHRAMLAAALGKQLQQRDDGGGGGGGAAVRRGVSAAARNAAVIAEAYPESETHAATTAAGELRLSDLLGGLSAAGSSGGAGLGGARKLLEQLDKRAAPVTAPLPRTVADRLERKAGYDDTKQEVTKWQPIVKANREAPTLRFTSARHEVPAAAASTAALVDGFTPDRSDPDGLEAQVAALLGAAGNAAAAAMEEAEQAVTEKAYTSDEAAARAAKLSRMRHLMFYAELKAKRLARIKSKEHHRRANRAAKRAAARAAEAAGDQQAEARAAEEEAEFERAKERLTLKHKNSSKWARRALKRGAAVVDVSTREALAAQLALGQQLRRKIEGRRGHSSGSSQEDESTSASEPEDADAAAAANTTGRLMSSRNRKEALAIMKGLSDPSAAAGGGLAGDDDSSSKRKGLFALPFMVRALEKQRAAAAQEAAALLVDMETGTAAAAAAGAAGVGGGTAADEFVAAAAAGGDSSGAGRMTFGGSAGAAAAARAAAVDALEAGSGSDDEEDVEAKAQRLGRHIAGDTAAATAAAAGVSVKAAVSRPQQTQLDNGSSKARQQLQQNAADVGTVEVELPSQGAGACAEDTPVRSAAGAAAAAATNSSAHADLFVSGKAARRKQQQQQPDVAGCNHPSSAAFIPCATWQGPREGYTFKLDKAGLGYHRDSTATQQDNTKQPSKAHRQQQQAAAVQPLLQRQQQHMEAASGDSDDDAARQQQQQQQQRQQNGINGSSKGSRGPAAAAAVHAMQLLSDEGDLQRQLLSAAFAGDDVEADFAADKSAEVEAELPPDQAEGQMPGWGTWKTQQREPAWMAAAKANAAAQRAAAAASRKDAQLKNVVISEKWDKKAAKYLANTLPFPFRDKDVYETAIRQPLGRQYNPDAAFRNLTRPAVLKDAGVVIEPLRHSKHVEQYNSGAVGKGRAVVTVAGGMQLQGQAAGTGAGGVGKGAGKKGQGSKHQKGRPAGSKTGSSKRGRLHDAAQ